MTNNDNDNNKVGNLQFRRIEDVYRKQADNDQPIQQQEAADDFDQELEDFYERLKKENPTLLPDDRKPKGFRNFSLSAVATEKALRSGAVKTAGEAVKEVTGQAADETFVENYPNEEDERQLETMKYKSDILNKHGQPLPGSNLTETLRQRASLKAPNNPEMYDSRIKELEKKAFDNRSVVNQPGIPQELRQRAAKEGDAQIAELQQLRHKKQLIEKYGDLDTAYNELYTRLRGENSIADKILAKADEIKASAPYYNPETTSGFLGSLVVSAVPSLAAIAATPFTAGTSLSMLPAALSIANIAALSSASAGIGMYEYEDYMKEKGLPTDRETMWKIGVLHGTFEAVAESLRLPRWLPKEAFINKMVKEAIERGGIEGVEQMLREYQQKTGQSIVKKFGKEMLKQGFEEGAEEMFTEAGQMISNTLYKDREDFASLGEIVSRFGQAGFGGFVMGAFLGMARVPSISYMQRKARDRQGFVMLGSLTDPDAPFPVVEIAGMKDGNAIVFTPTGQQQIIPVDQIDQTIQIDIADFKNYETNFQKDKGKAAEIAKEIENKQTEQDKLERVRILAKTFAHDSGKGYLYAEATGDAEQEFNIVSGKFTVDESGEAVIDDNETYYVRDRKTGKKSMRTGKQLDNVKYADMTPQDMEQMLLETLKAADPTATAKEESPELVKLQDKINTGLKKETIDEIIEVSNVETIGEGFVLITRTDPNTWEETVEQMSNDEVLDFFAEEIKAQQEFIRQKKEAQKVVNPVEAIPQTEETNEQQPQAEVITSAPQTEQKSQIPVTKNGEVDYDNINDPVLYAESLRQDFADEAPETIAAIIKGKKDKIKKITDISDIKKAKQKKKLQEEVKFLEQVQAQFSTQAEQETTLPPTGEQPVVDVGGVKSPDVSSDNQQLNNNNQNEQDVQDETAVRESEVQETDEEPATAGQESNEEPELAAGGGISDVQPTETGEQPASTGERVAETEQTTFKAGDKVTFDAPNGQAYQATIKEVLPTGNFAIETEDGQGWLGIKPEQVRRSVGETEGVNEGETEGEAQPDTQTTKQEAGQPKAKQPRRKASLSVNRNKALSVEAATAYDIALQFFIGGGRINTSVLQGLYGKKKYATAHEEKVFRNKVNEERKARISYTGNDGMTIDQIAHKLWDENTDMFPNLETSDYQTAIEDIIQKYKSPEKMATDLLEYQPESVEDELSRRQNEEGNYLMMREIEREHEAVLQELQELYDAGFLPTNEQIILLFLDDQITINNEQPTELPQSDTGTGETDRGTSEDDRRGQIDGDEKDAGSSQAQPEKSRQERITESVAKVESLKQRLFQERTKLEKQKKAYDISKPNAQTGMFGGFVTASDIIDFGDGAELAKTLDDTKRRVSALEQELKDEQDKLSSLQTVTDNQMDLFGEEDVAPNLPVNDKPQPTASDMVFGEQPTEVDKAAAEVDTNPTEAQKEAGNYKKGHVKVQGFDVTIENPKGSTRSGVDKDGKAWSVEMQNHYGYFKRTEGKDGDQIDVFIGDSPTSEKIFVVDQVKPGEFERESITGELDPKKNSGVAGFNLVRKGKPVFDESKVMLGFNSAEEAKAAYMSNYDADWKGFGSITETTVEDFKKWLYDGARQRKPFAEYKDTPEPTSSQSTPVQETRTEEKGEQKQAWEMTREEYQQQSYENDKLVEITRSKRFWKAHLDDYSDKLKRGIWKNKKNEQGVDLEEFAERQVQNAQNNLERLNRGKLIDSELETINRVSFARHKGYIQQALSEGKPVPAEVLKDYPDLSKTDKSEIDNLSTYTTMEQSQQKIEDFGEKIEGARKDQIKKYFDKINLNGRILSVIFPKPDIKALLESGMSIKDVAGIKVAYEFAVSEKKRGEDVIKFYAAYAKNILAESINLEFKNNKRVFTEYGKSQLVLRTEAYQAVSKELGNEYLSLDLSKVRVHQLTDGEAKHMVSRGVTRQFRVQYYVNTPKYFDTQEQAIAEFVEQVKQNTTKDTVEYKRKISVYRARYTRKFMLGYQPKGKSFITLADDFSTAKDAFNHLEQNEADLHLALERVLAEQRQENKKPAVRLKFSNETARDRVGKDWRNGKPVGSKEFAETFGFRGVEFGNWVNQQERQVFMNNSYDSFMDLAQLLNIPPKAISLGGKLGITFGSRGSGKAAAHYEPGRRIINLTKTQGLGSLAHEWYHAIDNYFADFGVKAENMLSATAGEYTSQTRDEVKKAFDNLYKTLNTGLYKLRSVYLDDSGNKRYFSLPHEMAARAFENYTLTRLNESGQINDFIVNYTSNEDWNGEPSKYPFPIGQESATINEAFQQLFDVLETKTDENNVSLLYEPLTSYNIYEKDEIEKAFGTEERKREAVEEISNLLRESEYLYSGRGESSLPDKVKPRTVVDGFQESGYIDVVGQKIETPQDLADLFAIHRSPYIEKYHVIFVKNGVIIGSTATTLNRIDAARTFEMDEIDRLYRSYGADGMYFLHNHPSGNHRVSAQDIYATFGQYEQFVQNGINLIGHVVIDTDRFSYIDTSKPLSGNYKDRVVLERYYVNEVDTFEYKNAVPKLFTEREDLKATNDPKGRIFEIAKALTGEKGYSAVVVYATSSLYVSAYDVVPYGSTVDDIKAIILNGINSNLGSRAFIVHDGSVKYNWGVLQGEVDDVVNTKTMESDYFLSGGNERKFEKDLIILWDERREYEKQPKTASDMVFGEDDIKPIQRPMFSLTTSPIGFFSPTEDALIRISQAKGTPEQMKAMLIKNGAKQAEMDWMGWDDYFVGNRKDIDPNLTLVGVNIKGTITKADIQQWIDQNKIDVQEVVKGKTEWVETKKGVWERKTDRETPTGRKAKSGKVVIKEIDGKYYTTPTTTKFTQIFNTLEEAQNHYDDIDGLSGDTKYSQYQKPGGENYKEVLLVMPVKGKTITIAEKEELENLQRRQNNEVDFPEKDLNRLKELMQKGRDSFDNKNQFKSSHFDEPNILAHVRFNERITSADGTPYTPPQRTLFIEEIQSDWAQKGKKEGFKLSEKEYESEWKKADLKYADFMQRMKDKYGENWDQELEKVEVEEEGRLLDAREDTKGGVIPSMPFKKTDQWVNLALRRMMRHAVENGFDRIAWTPGEVQAERYDLSKQVERLMFFKKKDGTYGGTAYERDGSVAMNFDGDANKLETIIGKEITQKIVEQSKEAGREYYLENQDLKVGGEGMKSFYDQIIPLAASKLGKPFGAKVEEIDIPLTKQYEVAKNTEDIKRFSKSGYSFTWNGGSITKQRAYEIIENGGQVEATPIQSTTVQSLPITESMRQSVMEKGVPLFQIIGEQGASNLDAAQEATTRMDNLKVAREMEEAGKDTKTIRLATGWERGADGKWRYETNDGQINTDALKELERNNNLSNQDVTFDLVTYKKENNGTYTIFMRKKGAESTRDFAHYRDLSEGELRSIIEDDAVVLRILNGEGDESMIGENLDDAKEIQVEFTTFITGAVPLTDIAIDTELFKAYPQLKDVVVRLNKSLGVDASYSVMSDGMKVISIGMVWNRTKSSIFHEIQHAIQEIEGFARGGNTRQFEIDNATKIVIDIFEQEGSKQKARDRIERLMKANNPEYMDRVLFILNSASENQLNQIIKDNKLSSQEKYRRLAGEVEARNIQSRLSLTPEQRRETLLAETEDVSREDQIFLYENSTAQSAVDYTSDNEKMAAIERLNSKSKSPVNTVIVKSQNQLPKAITDKVAPTSLIKGMMYGGTTYYVLDNILNATDAANLWIHEHGVHVGITRLIPDVKQRMEFFEKVVDDIGLDEIKKIVNPEVMKMPQHVIGEEYIAYLANKRISEQDLTEAESGVWQRFIDFVNRWLSKLMDANVRITEADIVRIAKAAIQKNFEDVSLDRDNPYTKTFLTGKAVDASVNRTRTAYDMITQEDKPAETQVYDVGMRFMATPLPPTVTVNGAERPTTNSKGLPIAQTEEGVRNFWKWFGDSKVVDEQGRPLVVYHGTPTGNFTVFKPLQFFSLKKEYADIYQSSSASSRNYNRPQVAPSTYEVYLKIEKPFDTRKSQVAKNIFNRFASHNNPVNYSYAQKLTDRGFPDWMELDNLVEFMDEMKVGRNFDGFILDEGSIGGYGNKVVWRGLSYVPRSNTQIKSATGNDGSFDGSNPDIRFSLKENTNPTISKQTQPVPIFNPDMPLHERFKNNRPAYWHELIADKWIRWAHLNNDIIRMGGFVPEWANVYLHATTVPSQNQAQMEQYDKKQWGSLMETIKETGLDLENLQKYMKAKHAPERNAKIRRDNPKAAPDTVYAGSLDNTPLTDEYAKKVSDMYEKVMGKAMVDKFWKAVNEATDFSLKLYVEGGFITKQDYDQMKAEYQFYVPLRGWKGDAMSDVFDYLHEDIDQPFQSPVKKAEGRTSEADDPLPYIKAMAYTAIMAKNKNGLKQKGLMLLRHNAKVPGFDQVMVLRKWLGIDTGQKDSDTGKPIYKEAFVQNGRVLAVEGYDTAKGDYVTTDMGSLEELKGTGILKLNENSAHYNRNTYHQAQQHEFEVWEKGVKHTIVMKADPNLAVVLGKGRDVGNQIVNSKRGQQMLDLTTKATRQLSTLLTSKNPAFIPVNFIRDISYATVAHGLKQDSSTLVFLSKIGDARGAIHRYMRDKTDPDNEIDKLYMRYKLLGGQTGFAFLNDLEVHRKRITKELKRLSGKNSIWDKAGQSIPIKAYSNTVEYLAVMSEDISRFATFLTSKQLGKSDTQAVNDAKNATVNFNQKGRIAPVLGMAYAFANAAIQGGVNISTLAYKNKSAFGKAATGFAVLGFMLAELMRFSLPDDDDYLQINEFLRDNYMVLPNPAWLFGKDKNKYITIPLPHGFRFFYSIGQATSDLVHGHTDPGAFGYGARIMENLVDSFSPWNLNIRSATKRDLGIKTVRPFVPTWGVPVYDLVVNEDFAGRRVYQEGFTPEIEKRTPASEKGLKSTNRTITGFAKALNKLGGGDENIPAGVWFDPETGELKKATLKYWMMNVNPAKIEHLIEGYTGGVGTFFNQSYKTLHNGVLVAVQDEPEVEFDAKDVPVLNRLYRQMYKANDAQKYYDLQRRAKDFKHFKKIYKENNDPRYQELIQNQSLVREMNFVESMRKRVKDFDERIEKAEGDWKKVREIGKEKEEFILRELKRLDELSNNNND